MRDLVAAASAARAPSTPAETLSAAEVAAAWSHAIEAIEQANRVLESVGAPPAARTAVRRTLLAILARASRAPAHAITPPPDDGAEAVARLVELVRPCRCAEAAP